MEAATREVDGNGGKEVTPDEGGEFDKNGAGEVAIEVGGVGLEKVLGVVEDALFTVDKDGKRGVMVNGGKV